jgi:branched-chain amino acid transport system substrate-binding protein
MFPNSQARVMWDPFNRLKFQFNADYRYQAGVPLRWVIEHKNRKTVCAEYQDTDFGKDIVQGGEDELAKMGMKFALKSTHKPTDTDLGTQILNLRNANCDLVLLGTLGRDGIIAYTTARRSGWTDVDFVAASPLYDPVVAKAPDNSMDGIYAGTAVFIPPREEMTQKGGAFFDQYQKNFGAPADAAAMNAYTGMDLIAIALDRAGKDVTTDKFIAAMESITDYQDIFGNPKQSYGPNKHLGADEIYVTLLKNGKYEKIAGPLFPSSK